MTPVILLGIALVGAACALAFTLATYALPFMLSLFVFRVVTAWGAGWIVAGIAGSAVGVSAFVLFVSLRVALSRPAARLALTVTYAFPAAVAGYALMHGVISGVQMSEPLRQILCLSSGAFVAFSAVVRLATPR